MSEIGPLKLVVCFKICPDTAQLRLDPRTRAPRLDDAPLRIGTFDEHALEEAIRLKETHGGKVVAITLTTVSPPRELILRALAMGADEVHSVEDPTMPQADALATASILRAAVREIGDADLVFCGEGSLDNYNRQVGPRLAEALGIPLLDGVTRIGERSGKLLAHRSLESRSLVVEVPTPALLTVGQEINEPRFPTVLQIMSASNKPTPTWTLAGLGFEQGRTAASLSGVRTLEIFAPPDSRERIAIDGETADGTARELADRLLERGLVRIR